MSSPPGAVPVDVISLAAPGLLGALFNTFFLGVLTVQAYLYYLSFPKDSLERKSLVATLCILELLQTVLVIADTFKYYVRDFTNVSTLDSVGLSWLYIPILGGIVSCVVQIFFVHRIWTLSKPKVVCAAILLVSLMQCGAALATGVIAAQATKFSRSEHTTYFANTIWQIGSAASDVLIATTMCFYLYKRKSSFRQTNILITRLIRMAIETCVATALLAITDAVLVLGFRYKQYYTAPPYMLNKIYVNTLLAILNNRIHINGGRNELRAENNTASKDFISFGHGTSTSRGAVHVLTNIETWTDPLPMEPVKSMSREDSSSSISQPVHRHRERALQPGGA